MSDKDKPKRVQLGPIPKNMRSRLGIGPLGSKFEEDIRDALCLQTPDRAFVGKTQDGTIISLDFCGDQVTGMIAEVEPDGGINLTGEFHATLKGKLP